MLRDEKRRITAVKGGVRFFGGMSLSGKTGDFGTRHHYVHVIGRKGRSVRSTTIAVFPSPCFYANFEVSNQSTVMETPQFA